MKLTSTLNVKSTDGSNFYQYFAVIAANLCIIGSGMHYGWPSPSLPKLLSDVEEPNLTITDSEGSWIAVMPLIGSVVGSVIAGVTVDILGRKRTILIVCVPHIISWVIVAFSTSTIMLCSARFIAGIADGCIFTAVPIYIGEIADPKLRGFLGSSVSLSWIFGILLVNLIGSYMSITATALISSMFHVACMLSFFWVPESSYQLIMKENHVEAKKSLQKFRGMTDVTKELDRITDAIKAQMKNSGKFLDLFTEESNRRAVYVMMGLRAAQQLSGTTAITFYTQPIFAETGDFISPKSASIVYFSIQVVMVIVTSLLVDKAGRRPLLIFSVVGSTICLFIEGTYFCLKTNTEIDLSSYSFVPVTGLIGFVIFFSSGLQSIPLLTLGELFSSNVKAFALCFADIYFSVIATVVSKFFQIMKDSFGMYVPFYAFAIFCVFGLVFIVICVPETKGKTLEEIQDYFKGLHKPKDVVKKESYVATNPV